MKLSCTNRAGRAASGLAANLDASHAAQADLWRPSRSFPGAGP
jgi:hypothetical protein